MSDRAPTNTRSDSVSSSGSPPASPGGRRRASSGLFANLQAQKLNESPVAAARRQSMQDQMKKSGFFGTMWNNFIHGPQSKN